MSRITHSPLRTLTMIACQWLCKSSCPLLVNMLRSARALSLNPQEAKLGPILDSLQFCFFVWNERDFFFFTDDR